MRKPPNETPSVPQEPEDNLDAAMEMVAETMSLTRKVSVSGDESPSQAQVIVRTTEEVVKRSCSRLVQVLKHKHKSVSTPS